MLLSYRHVEGSVSALQKKAGQQWLSEMAVRAVSHYGRALPGIWSPLVLSINKGQAYPCRENLSRRRKNRRWLVTYQQT